MENRKDIQEISDRQKEHRLSAQSSESELNKSARAAHVQRAVQRKHHRGAVLVRVLGSLPATIEQTREFGNSVRNTDI